MPEQPALPFADALSAWNEWLAQSERQWNAFFNDTMAHDEFSAGLGRFLDLFLHLQRITNEAMGAYFMAVNVPTRSDVLELGDRLLHIEGRLASMEAALGHLVPPDGGDGGRARAPAPRPPRTRQPPTD